MSQHSQAGPQAHPQGGVRQNPQGHLHQSGQADPQTVVPACLGAQVQGGDQAGAKTNSTETVQAGTQEGLQEHPQEGAKENPKVNLSKLMH